MFTLLSLPFSIRTLIYDQSAYASGMFFETTAIFLNITEILLWLTFFIYLSIPASVSFRPEYFFKLLKNMQWKNLLTKYIPFLKTSAPQINNITLLLTLFLLINFITAFFSKDINLSLLFTFKLSELCLLAWLIAQNILSRREIALILILTGISQGYLAMQQFSLQQDLGLQIIGEPHLGPNTPGVAKMDIGTEKLIRGYGTFPHPNLLGAFFVILFFYLDFLKWDKLKYLILLPLFFTFSRSAFLAIFIGLIIKALSTRNKFKKTIGALIVIGIFSSSLYSFFPERFTLDSGIFQRLDLLRTSWDILLAHPLGIGNANFILRIQEFTPYILKPWDFQPVHNLYALILTENGICGFIVFSLLLFQIFKFIRKKNKTILPLFIAILILGMFDHYLWDLDTGRFLFALTLGIIFTKKT